MSATAIGPIGARQINNDLYVGQSDLTTIQKAVSAAVKQGGSYNVIIPTGYAGADPISGVTGGSASITITDRRGSIFQNYSWSGSAYTPAPFTQLSSVFSFGTPGGVRIASNGAELSLDSVGLDGIHFNINSGNYVEFGDGQGNTVGVINSQGEANFNGGFSTPGGINLSLDANIGRDLSVGGDANIVGIITASSLQVSDTATINDLDVDGDATFRGDLFFSGTITGDVAITGSLSANSASFIECTVDDSPVRTFANTPDVGPGGMVWPPIGIAVSEGDHWQNPLDKATNTFTGSLHVQGKLKAYGWEAIEVGTSHVAAGTGQTGINPIISLTEADQPVDQRRWSNAVVGNQLWFSADTDAGANNGWLSVDRTGATATLITAYAPLYVHADSGAGYTTGDFGTTLAWNLQTGNGRTSFINNHGPVGGGFDWFNAPPNTTLTAATIPLMTLDQNGSLLLNGTVNPHRGAAIQGLSTIGYGPNTVYLGQNPPGAALLDSTGPDPATQGEFIVRLLSSDASLIQNNMILTSQGVAFSGSGQFNNVQIGPPSGSAATMPAVVSDGTNIFVNANPNGSVFLNWDRGGNGGGGVNFCNGAEQIMATVLGDGTASFASVTAVSKLLFNVDNQLGAGDFNTIFEGGFHQITTTLPNCPPIADTRGFFLLVLNTTAYGVNQLCYQIAMPVNSLGEIWFRMCYFGTWRSWQQVNATPH